MPGFSFKADAELEQEYIASVNPAQPGPNHNYDCAVFADYCAMYADIYRIRFPKIAREIQAIERIALAHITRAGHRCDRHVS